MEPTAYIAKVSFFLDTCNMEIIVITIQGQRIQPDNKARSRNFARLAHKLKMDPRAYILKTVCKIGRQEAYHKIRVIKPMEHPMFLDNHDGFKARYESVIRQALIRNAAVIWKGIYRLLPGKTFQHQQAESYITVFPDINCTPAASKKYKGRLDL